MSILNTIWAGFAIMTIGITGRLHWDPLKKKFFKDQCDWILSTKSTQDRLIRFAVLNKCIFDHPGTGKSILLFTFCGEISELFCE